MNENQDKENAGLKENFLLRAAKTTAAVSAIPSPFVFTGLMMAFGGTSMVSAAVLLIGGFATILSAFAGAEYLYPSSAGKSNNSGTTNAGAVIAASSTIVR